MFACSCLAVLLLMIDTSLFLCMACLEAWCLALFFFLIFHIVDLDF